MTVFPLENRGLFRNGALLLAITAVGHFIAYKIVHIPTQLELVLLLTVVFFYPILRKPVIGIYLLFTIMPFIPYLRRLYYLQHQRPSIDPLIAVGDIVIALTFIGLFFVFRDQHENEDKVKVMIRIVLGYFVYCFIRTFFMNTLPAREAIMQFHFFGPSVLFFFIGVLYAKNINFLRRIWGITLVICTIAALYGLKQLMFGYSEAESIWFSSISFTTLFIKGLARPFSIFQSPACFADYMLIGIIGILILTSWGTSKWRFSLLLLLPVFFYATLITSVRSNWIGIVLTLLLWLFLLQIKGARNRTILIVLISVVFIISQLLDVSAQYSIGISSLFSTLGKGFNQQQLNLLVTERTSAIANPFEEHSFLSRVALWKYIIILSIDPITALMGRGIGTLNADSLYITYLAQFGYPGIIFIIGFIFVTIKTGFKLLDRSSSATVTSLAKGITLMNIVFAVINLTGTHIHSFPGDVYFWFWNGVLVKLAAARQPETLSSSNETAHHA